MPATGRLVSLTLEIPGGFLSAERHDVEKVMDGMGQDEIESTFVVALARGETAGCIERTSPVTPEERRRMGLDIVASEDDEPDLARDDNLDR